MKKKKIEFTSRKFQLNPPQKQIAFEIRNIDKNRFAIVLPDFIKSKTDPTRNNCKTENESRVLISQNTDAHLIVF